MADIHAHYGPSTLYPPIEAYDTGFLKVSAIHNIYYEQSGNPQGLPVVYLHGGPGGGISPSDRQYFDPKFYRIIAFDQRGAGKSTPPAELKENDTWALVSDIETLRTTLGVDKWVVFGGSWGSTLALTYAIKHTERCKALILRGIFTLRQSELKWFYQEGASHVFPDAFDSYKAVIPEEERGDYITAYYKRLTSADPAVRREAGKAWSSWEMKTSKLYVSEEMVKHAEDDTWADQFARIECHYFVNKGFFETDAWILDNVDKIRHLPCVIVQGRYDVVCPAVSAWELHKKWPEAEFHLIPDSGHSAKEPGTTQQLVAAADKFKTL
ncbi:Alpha/Beta hydrolase protein [Obelidium mucronatum]|nr:Alpha/Beta hydrolase protein [Obelidium mucronatum]